MPILVKDYEWEETEESVRVTVPLKGVQPNKIDIFSTEEYIKVSYPPYLFEVFLFAPVEDVKNKATIGHGVVVFSLIKKEAGLWSSLQAPEAEDKDFTKRKREEAIQRAHERAVEEEKIKETQKREQERYALRQLMKMEEDEKIRIEEVKEQERQTATAAIEELKKQHNTKPSLNNLDSDDDDGGDDDEATVKENKNIFNEKKDDDDTVHINQTITTKSPTKTHVKNHFQKKNKKKDLLDRPLPAPRESGCIQVSFTPRPFKTAARESKAPEEEEWLKKVAEASRNKKTLKDDPDTVDMEEMNPLWLKDKGIGFYKAGNYVAAINAFTAALILDGDIPSLHSNRAACHLHLKQFRECVQDCTCALDLLTPPVPDNASSRCRALVRRGTAFFQINEYVE
ncbi:hypothetical protein QZH41_011121, partial [Actinostola sp. cb2023]